MFKENQNILQNILSKSEEEFVHYDLALDCINPKTGEHLINASDDTMTRFYAFRGNEIQYDADASLEANLIYERVFEPVYDRIDHKVIRRQYGKDTSKFNFFGLKYELGEEDCTGGISFRGDTMNSVATTNRAYYKSYEEWHWQITKQDIPLPNKALKLIDLYHTPGNFMILPWCSGVNINCERGTGYSRDYFDMFLMAIYNSFLEFNYRERENGIILTRILKDRQTVTFMRAYLMSFLDDDIYKTNVGEFRLDDIEFFCEKEDFIPGWESFVKKNMLQDFVETDFNGHYRKPKELWKGHFKEFIRTCDALPHKEEQYFEFWNNAAELIQLRSRRIYRKMKN